MRHANNTDRSRASRAALTAQHSVVASFDTHPLLTFNRDDDFDDLGRLRLDSPSYSPFIRRSDTPGD